MNNYAMVFLIELSRLTGKDIDTIIKENEEARKELMNQDPKEFWRKIFNEDPPNDWPPRL